MWLIRSICDEPDRNAANMHGHIKSAGVIGLLVMCNLSNEQLIHGVDLLEWITTRSVLYFII